MISTFTCIFCTCAVGVSIGDSKVSGAKSCRWHYFLLKSTSYNSQFYLKSRYFLGNREMKNRLEKVIKQKVSGRKINWKKWNIQSLIL